MIELREYQREAVDALTAYWLNGGGHALIEIPTGGGKSLCMAQLMRELYAEHEARILLLTHVRELVEQDAKAIQMLWPAAPIGIYSAGLKRRDRSAPILLASVQSVFRDPSVVGHRDVVVIDEAHLLSRRDDGQYQKVLAHLKSIQPHLRMAGFTATPFRTDSGMLTDGWRGKDALFDEIVYRASAPDLISKGYLSPISPYVSPGKIDLTGVKTTAGDYNKGQLQEACDRADINERVVNEIVAAGQDRRLWIVFAAGVDHAKHLRDLFRARDIDAEMVLGDTPDQERAGIIAKARAGAARCLVGNNVLTTGLDLPAIDLIGMVRPTKSKGLFVQMTGRGLRTSAGKQDCLLLDFTQNTLTFGPIDLIDGSKTDGGKQAAPVKECEACHAVVHISAKRCPKCNAPFPAIEDLKYTARASGAAVFSDQSEPSWMDVESVIYRRHVKEGAADSFRIDYTAGIGTVSQWIALESPTAGGMARAWWRRNSYSGEAPETVTEAMQKTDDLRVPGRIQVVRQGKFWRVIGSDFSVPAGKVIPVQRSLTPSGYSREMFSFLKARAS